MSSRMKLRSSTEICADCSAPGRFNAKISYAQKLARELGSLELTLYCVTCRSFKKSHLVDYKLIETLFFKQHQNGHL